MTNALTGFTTSFVFKWDKRSESHLISLLDFFGGTVKQNQAGYFYWHLRGPIAVKALMELVPYLRLKKTHARVLIAFQSRRYRGRVKSNSDRTKDDKDFATMKALNDRTPPEKLNY